MTATQHRMNFLVHPSYLDAVDQIFSKYKAGSRYRFARLNIAAQLAVLKLLQAEIPRSCFIEAYLEGYGEEPVKAYPCRTSVQLESYAFVCDCMNAPSAMQFGGTKSLGGAVEAFVVGALVKHLNNTHLTDKDDVEVQCLLSDKDYFNKSYLALKRKRIKRPLKDTPLFDHQAMRPAS